MGASLHLDLGTQGWDSGMDEPTSSPGVGLGWMGTSLQTPLIPQTGFTRRTVHLTAGSSLRGGTEQLGKTTGALTGLPDSLELPFITGPRRNMKSSPDLKNPGLIA